MYLRPRLGRSQNRKELAEISPQPDCPDPRAKKCKYWWSKIITHSVYWRKSIMWLWIISVWLCQAMDHKRLQHLFKKRDQAWQRFPLLMLVWLCLLPWIVVIFEKRNITIRSCPPAKVNTHQNFGLRVAKTRLCWPDFEIPVENGDNDLINQWLQLSVILQRHLNLQVHASSSLTIEIKKFSICSDEVPQWTRPRTCKWWFSFCAIRSPK